MIRNLGKNALYNVAGIVIPLFITIVTVPIYVRAIGEARYGILSLIWLTFGYFGLFDFGLSRATTNFLAKFRENESERRSIFYTSIFMNAALSGIAVIAFYFATPVILNYVAGDSPQLLAELPAALPWIACFLPLAMIGNVFIGSLEADERFLLINIIQTAGSVLLQTLPLLAVLTFGARLDFALIGMVSARIVSIAAFLVPAAMSVKGSGSRWSWTHGKALFSYGGWIAITNSVGPILVNVDQFMISSFLGVQAVVYYSVPFSIVRRIQIVPSALSRALFPQVSRLEAGAANTLTNKALKVTCDVMTILCAPAIVLSNYALELWMGPDFARVATPVAELLLVGAWFNGLAFIPFTVLQGKGRPEIVAKIHALQVVPFVLLLWLLLTRFGLIGAAIAWTIRVGVDAVMLFVIMGFHKTQFRVVLGGLAFMTSAWLIAVLMRPSPFVSIVCAFVIGGASLILSTLGTSWLRGSLQRRVVANKGPKIKKAQANHE